jgi:hypothetical protein
LATPTPLHNLEEVDIVDSNAWSSFSLITGIIQLVYLILIGFSVYCLVLFVKLARRGIKALDIYIKEKDEGNS